MRGLELELELELELDDVRYLFLDGPGRTRARVCTIGSLVASYSSRAIWSKDLLTTIEALCEALVDLAISD